MPVDAYELYYLARGLHLSMQIRPSQLNGISNLAQLSRLFGLTPDQLQYFRDRRHKFILEALLPKRRGGYRTVYIIRDDSFRNFLKALTLVLNQFYIPPSYVHGFVGGRSIVTNAQLHTRKKLLLNLDIKSFFESIKEEKIKEVFVEIGLKEEHALVFAKLVTIGGVLATGFSTSPVLANIVSLPMDEELDQLCRTHNATYTRYVDDISISSDTVVPSMEALKKIIASNGFLVNEDKCKLSKRGGCQYVTGLTVCDTVPRLPKQLKRNIRLELHYIRKYGLPAHLIRTSRISRFVKYISNGYGLGGYIAYINSVEPKFSEYIEQNLKELYSNDHSTI